MVFQLTVVPMSRSTRRRVGKSRVEIVDTAKDQHYKTAEGDPLTQPELVEAVFELVENMNPHTELLKVIDIREVA